MLVLLGSLGGIENNPIYKDSKGIITAGSWFYYNVTTLDEHYYTNMTIISMNQAEVEYSKTNYYPDGRVYKSASTINVIETGMCDFWINTTLFKTYLIRINNTTPTLDTHIRTYLLDENETYLHWQVDISTAYYIKTIEHWVRMGDYGIIVLHKIVTTKESLSVGTMATSYDERTLMLLKWWSPSLSEEEREEEISIIKLLSDYITFLALIFTFAGASIIFYMKKKEKCKMLTQRK